MNHAEEAARLITNEDPRVSRIPEHPSSMAAAQVHALLAIEARLGQIADALTPKADPPLFLPEDQLCQDVSAAGEPCFRERDHGPHSWEAGS